MAVSGFDTYYGDHPWGDITSKTRPWYEPTLLDLYRQRSLFRNFIPNKVDLRAAETDTINFTLMYDLDPTVDAIGLRDLWLPALHTDSAKLSITMTHYAGKVALHKFDEYITYWKKAGMSGLINIVRGLLGPQMIDTLDLLARNAFLNGPFSMYAGGVSDFSALTSTTDHIFKIGMVEELWLGLSYRHAPLAHSPSGPAGDIVILTTPGCIYDIRAASGSDWVARQQYTVNTLALPYEVGRVYGARFLQDPRLTLWNCGTQSKQVTIAASTSAGKGAYTTVDEVYTPGQSGAQSYVQCSAFSAGEFAVGDIVTIHTIRTSGEGVTNAPDTYSDNAGVEKTVVRRIVNVDADNNRLSFDMPLLQDYTTDLDGGVYGYITKGKHIHASIALGGPNGVVSGVGQPPAVHNPPVVDDIEAMHRFSWDAYMKYQRFRPEVFECIFSRGHTRVKGAKTV